MIKALWIIIYLMVGFGAYWLNSKRDARINSQIRDFMLSKGEVVYRTWLNENATKNFIPSKFNVFTVIAVLILSAAVWALWPLVIIGLYVYQMIKIHDFNIVKNYCK